MKLMTPQRARPARSLPLSVAGWRPWPVAGRLPLLAGGWLPLLARGWLPLAAALMMSACGTPPPAPQLYHLRIDAPAAATALRTPAEVAARPLVLQLMSPVRLPELLEHSELLLPQGQAGVQALTRHRWAEPLRDAVPRVLRHDLASLLGEAQVWSSPLPAGVVATRQLRVEVLSLQANAERSGVLLSARYVLSHPLGTSAPQTQTLQIQAASTAPTPDALVAAHRLALWQLAQSLASAVVRADR